MNIKESLTNFSLALALVGLWLESSQRSQSYILVAIILFLYATVILFQNISQKTGWKTIVSSARLLDLTYLAFGLGMIGLSKNLLVSSLTIPGLLLLVSGISIIGLNIGQIIGTGGNIALKENVVVGIIFGLLMLVGGIVWTTIHWSGISEYTILEKLNNVSASIVMAFTGMILIYFGFRRMKRSG